MNECRIRREKTKMSSSLRENDGRGKSEKI